MAELPPSTLAGLVAAGDTLGAPGAYAARIFGPFEFEGITLTLPTETFDGALTIELGGRRVDLIEVGPAHTRGDVVVHLSDDGVVFTGDILFAGGHPVAWAGPVSGWIAALDRVLALSPSVVVPGHGPVVDAAVVTEERDYFVQLTAEARALHDDGVPADEAARRLHDEDRTGWGEAERLAVTVATLYRDFGDDDRPDVLSLFGRMAALAGDRA
jgi:glyoxylase-like metal-dependent hydrolase (beta-lactamase superfamily II)